MSGVLKSLTCGCEWSSRKTFHTVVRLMHRRKRVWNGLDSRIQDIESGTDMPLSNSEGQNGKARRMFFYSLISFITLKAGLNSKMWGG